MRIIALVFGVLTVLLTTSLAHATTSSFSDWIYDFRQDAQHAGISEHTLNIALPVSLSPLSSVLALDQKQPELNLTLNTYLQRTVTPSRTQEGRRHWLHYQDLLKEISTTYRIDPSYLLALWAMETNYGRNTGNYNIVQALATLAYDGRRAKFFRHELLNALKILDQDHISPHRMTGSWAGAMGQTQFMPSSFLRFAQDYDADGRRDIWHTPADVFASAAHYLSENGWTARETWGRPVALPQGFDRRFISLQQKHSLRFWHNEGVRLPTGEALPLREAYKASLIQPDGPHTQAYLVYDNFRVILRWNKSTSFAVAVGLLSDRLQEKETRCASLNDSAC